MKIPVPYEMTLHKNAAKIKNAVFGKANDVATKIPSASAIKVSLIKAAKKTATATKERAKVRGVAAGELAAGGLVAKVAANCSRLSGSDGCRFNGGSVGSGLCGSGSCGRYHQNCNG